MIPDEIFSVRQVEHGKWGVYVTVGYEKRSDGHLYSDWKRLYTESSEQEAREKLQWFVDRMKAYVVGV